MSISVPPRLPLGSTETASSPATSPQPSPRAATRQTHADLASRQRQHAGTGNSFAPRNRPVPSQANAPGGRLPVTDSMLHSALHPAMPHTPSALQLYGEALARPFMTTPPLRAFLSPPVAAEPYVAPSVAGLQCVSFAQMTPEDARAALLAMDIAPQFLETMKGDLNHCTNPYSADWSADRTRQFVATYGQLVAMPNGLDNATVAALYRMLASPEPTTPTPPAGALADQPQRQTLPFMQMTLEDARAALQAMEVAPPMLARMTKDLLICVETEGSPVGPECARQFQHEYGHLLAMPPHLDAAALTTLVNLLMDLPEAQPQVQPQVQTQVQPQAQTPVQTQVQTEAQPQAQAQAEPRAVPQTDTPAPLAPRLALHAMEPAEAMKALLALNLPEQQLVDMAQHLMLINYALNNEDSDGGSDSDGDGDGESSLYKLAMGFVQNHGHLIELPEQLQSDILRAMAKMLISAIPEED